MMEKRGIIDENTPPAEGVAPHPEGDPKAKQAAADEQAHLVTKLADTAAGSSKQKQEQEQDALQAAKQDAARDRHKP